MLNIDYSETLGNCSPAQVVSITDALNTIECISVYDTHGNKYCNAEYAYSLDGVCWCCYMSFDKTLELTEGLAQDFYVRAKVNGTVGAVKNGDDDIPYTTQLAQGFNFNSSCVTNSNIYNPYANMDVAMNLYQYMSDYVNCVVGIPITYFKVKPNASSKDVTFKEYCLMNVVDRKQIKLLVKDGQMPSSRPEFNDFGIDFMTDWECEISKSMFATAFGVTEQPQEGDIIYIPLQNRMWMISSAYDEKKDGFMWQSTVFKVNLTKYQEKDSVDLQDQEQFVSQLVTNTYENLFGDNEQIDSGEEHTEAPVYVPNSLYAVFESDATRKYASVEQIEFKQEAAYQKAMKLADNFYLFGEQDAKIVYQHKYCGEDGTVAFLIKTMFMQEIEGTLMHVGNIRIDCHGDQDTVDLKLFNNGNQSVTLNNNILYIVYLRWSRKLNVIEFVANEYTHNQDIPLYKLKPFHYYFNMDDTSSKSVTKYNVEMVQDTKGDIVLDNIPCMITNIKVFDNYHDNLSELMQQYPNSKHLIVNDTARKFVDLNGNPQN